MLPRVNHDFLFKRRRAAGGSVTVPAPALAYSRHSLFGFAGDIVEDQRDSDSALQDFTGSQIESGSKASWVGAGDGFVATAYNQGTLAGVNATQGVATDMPRDVLAGVLDAGIYFPSGDHLDFTLASETSGTVIVATTKGIYAAEQTLSAGNHALSAKGVSANHTRFEMRDTIAFLQFGESLSEAQIDSVVSALVLLGGVESFATVSNYFSSWRGCSDLKDFPVIDTSGGTTFRDGWRECAGLIVFPLLDVSRGADFNSSWRDCSGLTNFPLLDADASQTFRSAWQGCLSIEDFPASFFDSWTGIPSNNCFTNAWLNCSSLTATSVENILNSIDTSGLSAPGSGFDITIDYDAGSGTPNVTTAVTNLKARGWTITLNGVAQ